MMGVFLLKLRANVNSALKGIRMSWFVFAVTILMGVLFFFQAYQGGTSEISDVIVMYGVLVATYTGIDEFAGVMKTRMMEIGVKFEANRAKLVSMAIANAILLGWMLLLKLLYDAGNDTLPSYKMASMVILNITMLVGGEKVKTANKEVCKLKDEI
jgi:hypothetical protein